MNYYLKTHFTSGEKECTVEYEAWHGAEKVFSPAISQTGEMIDVEVNLYVYLSMLSQAAVGGRKAVKGYGIDEYDSRVDSKSDLDLSLVSITYWFERKEGFSNVPEKVSLELSNVQLTKENPIDPYAFLKEQTALTKNRYDLTHVYISCRPEEDDEK